jgi:hypothetical protein
MSALTASRFLRCAVADCSKGQPIEKRLVIPALRWNPGNQLDEILEKNSTHLDPSLRWDDARFFRVIMVGELMHLKA